MISFQLNTQFLHYSTWLFISTLVCSVPHSWGGDLTSPLAWKENCSIHEVPHLNWSLLFSREKPTVAHLTFFVFSVVDVEMLWSLELILVCVGIKFLATPKHQRKNCSCVFIFLKICNKMLSKRAGSQHFSVHIIKPRASNTGFHSAIKVLYYWTLSLAPTFLYFWLNFFIKHIINLLCK